MKPHSYKLAVAVAAVDVVDIAIDALLAPLMKMAGDRVDFNDMAYNSVFPYESTPQNGRIHGHHGLLPQ